MGYVGMCRCEGYGFQAVYFRIGCINQSVWVQNRVSFFRKLISWLKILSRLGKQLLQDRGILGVYSSTGQQNSAELALAQVKGSRVPAAHPHPEIPKVPPRVFQVHCRFAYTKQQAKMSMGNIANPFSKKQFHIMIFSVSVTTVFTIYNKNVLLTMSHKN